MTRPLSFKSVYQPAASFEVLSRVTPSPVKVFFSYTIWLLVLPPVFAWLGAYAFGWRLGANDPLWLPTATLTMISAGYFLALVFGFVSTSIISRWMATTYGARTPLGVHFALVTVVGSPLAIASVAHLFPHVFFNVLVLIPTTIWSMYLLYKGLPIVLGIPPERGMLMASSLVAWLLVAAVSLLGITMGLWVAGFGPFLGV